METKHPEFWRFIRCGQHVLW